MYRAEVLKKFPVIQHTLFGAIFTLGMRLMDTFLYICMEIILCCHRKDDFYYRIPLTILNPIH